MATAKTVFIWNKDFVEMSERRIFGPLPPFPKQRVQKPAAGLPAYLAALYSMPLLSKAQEVHLFRQFNWLRWKRTKARKPELYTARILPIRDFIIKHNLRLSMFMAKKRVCADIFERVSTANVGLCNAVDCFDYGRKAKFSTYACNAIMMQFRREYYYSCRDAHVWHQGDDEAASYILDDEFGVAEDTAERNEMIGITHDLLARLTDKRQKMVIKHRYGIGTDKKMLDEVGKMLGVTKERVRQIENRALHELRFFATSTFEINENERDGRTPTQNHKPKPSPEGRYCVLD